MSDLSIQSYMPCCHLDLSDKKAALGTYDYAALLKQQANMAEEERRAPQIGRDTLTSRELQALAAKYDPTNMTNAEYNSFVNELLEKGVLGRSEAYGVYSDRVVLRPGHLSEGGIAPSPSASGLSVRTLADAEGGALRWTSVMAQWRGGSFDSIRADAFQKIFNILQEISRYRMEREKTAEVAVKADELTAAAHVIYEQREEISR